MIVTVMLFIPLVLLIALVAVPKVRAMRLKRVGIKVKGRCVSISQDDNASIASIEYSINGAAFLHQTNPSYVLPIAKGDKVDLVYDPRNPKKARVADWLDGEPGGRFFTWGMVVLELIFLVPQILWVVKISG
ncbi:DUF3592 domain-containing protein [Streptoverticillium reticulum]|uniref:DUF3592 domain-containing protein n=1 Tax=Streptoverticillium reticulum TaxID=1433415 RepID=UPI0039BFA4C6